MSRRIKQESLGELLAHAGELKTAQLRDKRPEFEAAPDYMRVTAVHSAEVLEARTAAPSKAVVMAASWKDAGTDLFKDGKFEEAIDAYSRAVSVWQWWEKQGEEEMKCVNRWAAVPASHTVEVREQVLSSFLNIAACSLKLQRPHDTIYASNQAMVHHPDHPKALYRRAMAAVQLDTAVMLELAVADLQKAVQVAPQDKQLRSALKQHKEACRVQRNSDKKTYSGMFDGKEGLYPEDDLGHSDGPTAAELAKARELGLDLNDPAVASTIAFMEKSLRDNNNNSEPGWKHWLVRAFDRERWINVTNVGYCVIFSLTFYKSYQLLTSSYD